MIRINNSHEKAVTGTLFNSFLWEYYILLTPTFSGTPIGRKTRAISTGILEMIVGF